ncbi:MAG: glycogen synthase, partial [Brevinema sp.]
MVTKKKILFASSEVVPFAKVGGLGDVVSALSKALIQKKQDVCIIIPKYRSVSEYLRDNHIKIENSYKVALSFNDVEYPFTIEEVTYQENRFMFIDMPEFFDRDNPYIDIVTGKDYNDNLHRYVIFNRAVLETCKFVSWIPDIIHCHDWQMGLIPLFKKALPEYNSVFYHTKTVFTIHNLAYQGVFPIDQYETLGIDWKYFHVNGLEYYRHINLLKGGIVFSDAVNTVSENYAVEIQTEGGGVGLEGVIQEKNIYGNFCGIMNGVDYTEWDPSIDEFLQKKYALNYNYTSLDKKKQIKDQFAKENHLQLRDDTPLIGIITRLYDQKGLDIFTECAIELLENNIAFTILGTGKKEYEDILLSLAQQYPKLMNVMIGFNIERSHEIEAACDMFLMPSKFEPSGLNQLYSLRYGTVPIVRNTGGLADTVSNNVTGFVFDDYHPDALRDVIFKAVEMWRYDKPAWAKIVKAGMKKDWSWKRSAKQYLDLYQDIL